MDVHTSVYATFQCSTYYVELLCIHTMIRAGLHPRRAGGSHTSTAEKVTTCKKDRLPPAHQTIMGMCYRYRCAPQPSWPSATCSKRRQSGGSQLDTILSRQQGPSHPGCLAPACMDISSSLFSTPRMPHVKTQQPHEMLVLLTCANRRHAGPAPKHSPGRQLLQAACC
jgi:hypothetical protein